MKKLRVALPRGRQQLLLTGAIAIVVVALAAGAYAVNQQKQISPIPHVAASIPVDQPKENEQEAITPTVEAANPVVEQPVETAPTVQEQPAAQTLQVNEDQDAYLNKLCDGVTRYLVNLQLSNDAKLSLMQHARENGNMIAYNYFQQYNQCVEAGKIQPL